MCFVTSAQLRKRKNIFEDVDKLGCCHHLLHQGGDRVSVPSWIPLPCSTHLLLTSAHYSRPYLILSYLMALSVLCSPSPQYRPYWTLPGVLIVMDCPSALDLLSGPLEPCPQIHCIYVHISPGAVNKPLSACTAQSPAFESCPVNRDTNCMSLGGSWSILLFLLV